MAHGPTISGERPRTRLGLILLLLATMFAVVAATAVVTLDGAEARQFPSRATLSAAGMPLADTAYPVPRDAVFVSPRGDDAARGGKREPLRTVRAAVDRAPDGGTVVIRQGTYRESVGQVRKRVTIQPYPHERVWLKGSVLLADWQRAGSGWRHSGWQPDLCRDCHLDEIIDPRHPLAGQPDMVFVDGQALRQVASADLLRRGTFHVDPGARTLTIGENPSGKRIEAAAFDHLLQFDGERAAGSGIRGIGIAHYASNQSYGDTGGMVIANAPGITLSRNTFGFGASTGALITQPGAKIKANRFLGNGLAGLVANEADDLRLVGNSFVGNNQERFALSGPAIGAAGAKVTHTRRAFVADNRFRDNFATGWWCDLGCTDAVVVRNVARGNDVHGLYYEVSSRALIGSNVLTDNRANGLKISSSDGVDVYHNTFAGNQTDVGLYNDPRSPSSDPYSESLGLSWVTERTTLVNNLFAERGPTGPVIDSADYKSPPTPARFVRRSDGNAFLRSNRPVSGPMVIWSLGNGRNATYANLGELRAGTGGDRASIERVVAKPPFADRPGGDFRLPSTAPGYRAGRPLPAAVAGRMGVPAAQRPDIGTLSAPRPY